MNFATFDLNLLRVLDALFLEGSTVKAADRLGLTQPAVSNALSRLRHALDDQLFVRQGNRLVPTSYAVALQPKLRAELERIEDMLSPADAFDPATAKGTFILSGSDFFAETLMPAFAALLYEKAPGVRAQLVDIPPDVYFSRAERQAFDLALGPMRKLPDWFCHQPLFRSTFVVIARENHPQLRHLQTGDTVPMETFCDVPHVLFSQDGSFTSFVDQALARENRQRKVALTVPVFSGVCRMVSESDHLALVPGNLARKLAPSLSLGIFEPPLPMDGVEIVGMWHQRLDRDPLSAWAREQVFALIKQLG